MLSIRLSVNRLLVVKFWRNQKLHTDFQLHVVSAPNFCIAQASTVLISWKCRNQTQNWPNKKWCVGVGAGIGLCPIPWNMTGKDGGNCNFRHGWFQGSKRHCQKSDLSPPQLYSLLCQPCCHSASCQLMVGSIWFMCDQPELPSARISLSH